MSRIVLLLALFAVGCRTMPVRPASPFPYEDDLSLRGFLEEVVVGHATPRTHRFDAYTKGSYHVNAYELVHAVPRTASLYRLELRSVAVIGPHGPLWAYDVIVIARTPDCLRVNWLTMPHARITVKRSGCVTPELAEQVNAHVGAMTSATVAFGAEHTGCMITARGANGLFEVWQSLVGCYEHDESLESKTLHDILEQLSKALEVTYSSYRPIEDEEP